MTNDRTYTGERNRVIETLRTLATREYKAVNADPDSQWPRVALAHLSWAIQHLDGLPEHWIATSPDEPSTNEAVASFDVTDLVDDLNRMADWMLDCGCHMHAGKVADELEKRVKALKTSESGAPLVEAGAGPLVSPQKPAPLCRWPDCECEYPCAGDRFPNEPAEKSTAHLYEQTSLTNDRCKICGQPEIGCRGNGRNAMRT